MKYFFKKNMAALLISLVILVLSFAAPWIIDQVYEVENMSFTSYDIDVQIENDGDIYIHETIVGRFDSGMHVLFKDIPFLKNSNEQTWNRSSFDESSVEVKIYNARGLLYDSSLSIASEMTRVGYSWEDDRDEYNDLIRCPQEYGVGVCHSIFTYVPMGISPTTTYEFFYRIEGAVSTYADIAELNWAFYDPLQSMKIQDASVTIHYPAPVSSVEDIYFYGHGAKAGQLDILTTESLTFSYPKIYPNDVIEMRLLFPSSLITNPRSGTFLDEDKLEYFIDIESAIERRDQFNYYLDFAGLGLATLAIIMLLLLAFRMYRLYDKEHVSTFDGEYYRELPAEYPPAEMGYLYRFRDVGGAELSATLMDLIRRNYVEVDDTGQSTTDEDADYTLHLNPEKDRTLLTKYEDFLLTWFFETIAGKDAKVSLKEIEKYAKAQATAQKYLSDNQHWSMLLKTSARKRDFFDEKSEQVLSMKKGQLAVNGLMAIIYILIALSRNLSYMLIGGGALLAIVIFLTSYFVHIKRRSIKGNDEYQKWVAFKKFLTDFSRFEDYPLPSIVIWEHYLVYAVAFGIADLVQKQLKLRYNDVLPAEYQRSVFTRYSYMPTYLYLRVHSYQRAAQQTVQKMQSSGKGGRGGFGGGRSFGGGGGGFRGR